MVGKEGGLKFVLLHFNDSLTSSFAVQIVYHIVSPLYFHFLS